MTNIEKETSSNPTISCYDQEKKFPTQKNFTRQSKITNAFFCLNCKTMLHKHTKNTIVKTCDSLFVHASMFSAEIPSVLGISYIFILHSIENRNIIDNRVYDIFGYLWLYDKVFCQVLTNQGH